MDSHNAFNPFYLHIRLDQPALYEIRVQGRIDAASLMDWFQSPVRCVSGPIDGQPGEATTTLTGIVLDQAALHGLLNRIRDMGLPLLYVDCISAHADGEKTQDQILDESNKVSGGSNE